MGNCLPKLRKKNKVCPDTTVSVAKTKETNVSDILSRSSASQRMSSSGSGSCEAELEMVRELTMSDVDSTSVESVALDKEISVLDELKETAPPGVIKKPVFFQVDFVQGMPHRMPSRLAERMEQKVDVKRSEHLALTEEDEILMNEIMEEVEAKERLEKLAEQQLAAQNLREQYLQGIREKARGMRSRPQTRIGQYGLALTEEDEILMNEIMEEVEAKERLEKLAEQQLAAQNLREQYLQGIREKARGMRSRPQTRIGQYGVGESGMSGGEEKG